MVTMVPMTLGQHFPFLLFGLCEPFSKNTCYTQMLNELIPFMPDNAAVCA